MEGLVLTMAVTLPMKSDNWYLNKAIMYKAEEYCDELWVDKELIPWSKTNIFRRDTPKHCIKYVFKPGIDFIPEKAFYDAPNQMTIQSITIPEGIKKLKNSCFYNCQFVGNLILPESLERICVDAFSGSEIYGVFRLPSTIKYISSLPKSEEVKDEIILPEGMVSYTPSTIVTHHLHIPSTLKNCNAIRSSRDGNIQSITIDQNNPVFILRDGELINLNDEKREKQKKMQEISRKAIISIAFEGTGYSYTLWDSEIAVTLIGKHRIIMKCPRKVTVEQAEQIVSIAQKYKGLIESSGYLDNLKFLPYEYQLKDLGSIFIYSDNVRVFCANGDQKPMDGLCKATAFFKKLTRLADELMNLYKEKALSYYLLTR